MRPFFKTFKSHADLVHFIQEHDIVNTIEFMSNLLDKLEIKPDGVNKRYAFTYTQKQEELEQKLYRNKNTKLAIKIKRKVEVILPAILETQILKGTISFYYLKEYYRFLKEVDKIFDLLENHLESERTLLDKEPKIKDSRKQAILIPAYVVETLKRKSSKEIADM